MNKWKIATLVPKPVTATPATESGGTFLLRTIIDDLVSLDDLIIDVETQFLDMSVDEPADPSQGWTVIFQNGELQVAQRIIA